MELYQLRGFTVVAEEGHVTRAAERLHVSQPALSAQIRALEDELGVALFDRVPGGMELTGAGRRLLESARAVVAAAQVLQNEASMLRGEIAGRVRLGTMSDPDFVRLPALLTGAHERYPLLELEVSHEVTGEAFAKVRDGELDASFYFGDLTHPNVASVTLREIGFRFVGPAAWSERIVGAPFSVLAAEPWIFNPPISTYRAIINSFFQAHNAVPGKVIEADNEPVIRSLVVAGVGLALIREDVARSLAEAGEVCVWEGERPATKLRFISRADRARDPVLQAMHDLVRHVWIEPKDAKRKAAAKRPRSDKVPPANAE